MAKIQSIYRYPIKGLSPERLDRATLTPGQTIPGDRLYAIENGPSGFDPGKPYLPKTRFLMLMKNERLASLRTRFDQDSHVLTISFPCPRVGEGGNHSGAQARNGFGMGGQTPTRGANPNDPHPYPSPQGGGVIAGDLRTPEGRAAIERFFAEFCANELRGPPKILHAEGHSFSDVAKKVVSIINLASVAALEDMTGAPVNPLRFRANLYVDGWPAWRELDLVGTELTIGQVGRELRVGQTIRLKVVKRIVRCAATNVDPDTGIRDLDIPQTLTRHLDHSDCGIYAEVIDGGALAAGDEIQIV